MCRNQEVKTECFERHESCQWNYASPVLTSSMTFSFPSCLSLPSFEEWPTASNLHSKASDLQIHKENMNFRFQVRVRFQVLVRVLQRNERNRTNCICLSLHVCSVYTVIWCTMFFSIVYFTLKLQNCLGTVFSVCIPALDLHVALYVCLLVKPVLCLKEISKQ